MKKIILLVLLASLGCKKEKQVEPVIPSYNILLSVIDLHYNGFPYIEFFKNDILVFDLNKDYYFEQTKYYQQDLPFDTTIICNSKDLIKLKFRHNSHVSDMTDIRLSIINKDTGDTLSTGIFSKNNEQGEVKVVL